MKYHLWIFYYILKSSVGQELKDLARFAYNIGMPSEIHMDPNKTTLTPVDMANHFLHNIPMFKVGLLKTFTGILLPILHILVILAVLLFAVVGTTALVCSLTNCFEEPTTTHLIHRPGYNSYHNNYYKKKHDHHRPNTNNVLHTFVKSLEDSSEKYEDNSTH